MAILIGKFRYQFALFALAVLSAAPVSAARLKDIADVEGVRGNQLYGFGVVIGLNGTGDGNSSDFTTKALSNLLEKMGIKVPADEIKVKNVAAVMVTATLPAFTRPGTRLDITISSLGDAKSLQGGTLLFTPLRGADGNTYAVAQGEISVGGFAVEGGGDSAQKNHPTVGMIAGGATVERAIPFDLFQSKRIRIVLRRPDFTTMTRVVRGINLELGRPLAVAVDSASVEIPIVADLARDPIGLVAKLESIEVEQDVGARVVVNERTGTIIMGETVRLGKVALAHGNLNIVIRTETQVSQPSALSETGETAIVTNGDVQVGEEKGRFGVLGGEVTLGELVSALNALGATPRDFISIFQALKRAGALHAELDIM
ncbi:MAG: flagellar biosynthesis protein FlgA [Proteobacteria bacterium]|nr:MAG: flagellar biosynthesis protein FlgA [Pseudomonadota bacterium]